MIPSPRPRCCPAGGRHRPSLARPAHTTRPPPEPRARTRRARRVRMLDRVRARLAARERDRSRRPPRSAPSGWIQRRTACLTCASAVGSAGNRIATLSGISSSAGHDGDVVVRSLRRDERAATCAHSRSADAAAARRGDEPVEAPPHGLAADLDQPVGVEHHRLLGRRAWWSVSANWRMPQPRRAAARDRPRGSAGSPNGGTISGGGWPALAIDELAGLGSKTPYAAVAIPRPLIVCSRRLTRSSTAPGSMPSMRMPARRCEAGP